MKCLANKQTNEKNKEAVGGRCLVLSALHEADVLQSVHLSSGPQTLQIKHDPDTVCRRSLGVHPTVHPQCQYTVYNETDTVCRHSAVLCNCTLTMVYNDTYTVCRHSAVLCQTVHW